MRTVLYFRLGDIAAAKQIQAKVREVPAAPVHMGGPWFIQRDNQAIDGLPNAEASQTTYREEWAVAGALCGTTLAVLAILHFGSSAGTFASVLACVGGGAIGALAGWRLGARLGARIRRGGIARRQAQLAQGEMLLVATCSKGSKESVKLMIGELGGVSVEEHRDVLPDFRWA
jgi:hypothetical protein